MDDYLSVFSEKTASPLVPEASLYVVATPLGNLRDMTLRGIAVLKAVDVIAAEDTRHSQPLLDMFGIRTRLLSVHEHNEQTAANVLIELLAQGKQVALISDAGTPAISDPGARVVERIRTAGYPVVPVPGACAAIAALSVAGLPETAFRFVGFLPPKSAARIAMLSTLKKETCTLIFYEAPHRVVECVSDMNLVFGEERTIVVAREMTKRHEEIVRLPLGMALPWFSDHAHRQRGEFVLVVSGATPVNALDAEADRILHLLLQELPLKTAVALAAQITNLPRKQLYTRALKIKGEDMAL